MLRRPPIAGDPFVRLAAAAALVCCALVMPGAAASAGTLVTLHEAAPPTSIIQSTGTTARAFAEDEWTLETALAIDAAAPGRYDQASDLGATALPPTVANTADPAHQSTSIRSHLIVAQRPAGASVRTLDATITFGRAIVGVIVTNSKLNASDRLGADVDYPTASASRQGRGLDLGTGGDWFRLTDVQSGSPRTLRLHLRFGPGKGRDQIRVLTAAPVCDWVGGPGADIHAAAGKTVLCGLGGEDVLTAGNVPTILRGGTGTDKLIGGSAADVLWGNSAGDNLYPRGGSDQVHGGRDRDEVSHSESGTDAVYFEGGTGFFVDLAVGRAHPISGTAGAAIDRLDGLEDVWGTPEADEIHGSARNETFFGLGGDDVIFGGPGNDWLNGDDPYDLDDPVGDDQLHGEAGDDWFYGGLGDDLIDGGPGDDSVRYSFSNLLSDTEGVTIDLRPGDPMAHCPGSDPCAFGRHGTDHLVSINNVLGSVAADTIYGNDDDNVLRGGDGNDIIHGGKGDDLLIADDGTDTLYGDAGNDLLIDTCYASDPVSPDAHCTPGVDDGLADTLDGSSDPPPATDPYTDVCRHIGADTTVHCDIVEVSSTSIAGATLPSGSGAPSLGSHDTKRNQGAYDLTGAAQSEPTSLRIIFSALASDRYGIWADEPDSLDPGGDAAVRICAKYNGFGGSFVDEARQACMDATANNWDIFERQFTNAAGHSNAGSKLSCVRLSWNAQAPEDVTYSERYASVLPICKRRY